MVAIPKMHRPSPKKQLNKTKRNKKHHSGREDSPPVTAVIHSSPGLVV